MSFFPTYAQDVVAVLAADFTQVFPTAKMIKVTIGRGSKAMEHPLETGAVVTDHRIVLPVTAELYVVIAGSDYRAAYQQIGDLFKRGELLTVQTRVDSFPSMIIEKMPHDETGDMIDGVAVAISLKEAQFVASQYSALTTKTVPASKVARPKDASTVNRGQQQPKATPPERKGSVLAEVFR